MRKILVLQAIAILMLALCGLLFWRGQNEVAGGVLLIALAASIANLIWMRKSEQMMTFLIGQTRPPKPESRLQDDPLQRKRVDMLLFANQINPHFLYNTLDSIRGQALATGQREIALMTEKLSRFFRYCISSRGNIVKLSEEVRNVQDYFGIQEYRFGDRIHMHLQVEDDSMLSYYVPKLTIQPIVENAIAHGIEEHTGRGTIWVKITATEQNLYIHIIDDGGGISSADLQKIREKLSSPAQAGVDDEKHAGIAIKNVNARIQLCFGPDYGLHYRSILGSGTDVEIVMPLIDDFSRVRLEDLLRDTST